MIRVVEIINEMSSRGGAEVFFCDLCKELLKNSNVELFIVILHSNVDSSFSDFISDNSDRVFIMNKKKGIDLKTSFLFKKLMNHIKPDIINSHLDVIFTYFFAFGFKKKKWRIVHTVHNIANRETPFFGRLFRKVYLKIGMLEHIGISDSITNSIKIAFPNAPVTTIYNGINFCEGNQCFKNEISDKKYSFICVARFSEQKNHKLLLNAFNSFYLKHNEATILCLGDGHLKNAIKEKKRLLECKNNFVIHDAVADVYPFLLSSKCFVLSSVYEGNPISILEAMSVGLPIVAPHVGGIPDVVENGENGFLFEPNNEKELVACLEKAYESKDLERMRKNNIEKSKKYSIKTTCNLYVDAFFRINDGGF